MSDVSDAVALPLKFHWAYCWIFHTKDGQEWCRSERKNRQQRLRRFTLNNKFYNSGVNEKMNSEHQLNMFCRRFGGSVVSAPFHLLHPFNRMCVCACVRFFFIVNANRREYAVHATVQLNMDAQ